MLRDMGAIVHNRKGGADPLSKHLQLLAIALVAAMHLPTITKSFDIDIHPLQKSQRQVNTPWDQNNHHRGGSPRRG